MYATIAAAAEAVRTRRVTPVELVEQCLERIALYEQRVQAWVFVDRDGALARAQELTEELERGWYRGPLHGIPIGVKDIFDVFDWPTGAGSALWERGAARQDATVVRKLREAGAIFLGKTVTTQYASFDPPKTRNPWDPSRTPGGSSSGSAAALACGMCLGALGSQTGGSITRPAAFCGVAGCKPTFGRVSCHGVVPLAPSLDHPGPMARCVRDLAILLQALAGRDPLDPATRKTPVPDYPRDVENFDSWQALGELRGPFADLAEPAVADLMEDLASQLAEAGHEPLSVALPASFGEVLPRHRTVMAVEAAAFHAERLRRHPDDYRPRIRGLIEEGLRCPAPEYARCKEHQRRLSREIMNCFRDVDVLLCPAARGPAPDASSTGDPAFNSPWSYTGLPTVSIPAGWTPEGMPLAVQLVGRPWSEAQLLSAAAWLEQLIRLEEREPKVV